MYCYNCGKKIKDDSRFCPFCGAEQSEKTGLKKQHKILIISLILFLCLIGCGIFFLHPGKDATADQPTDTVSQEENQESAESAPLSTLLFASDFQKEEGWGEPIDNLMDLIGVAAADGKTPDEIIICGDFTNDRNLHDYQISPEESIGTILSEVPAKYPTITEDNILFEQGNHDQLTESISESGLHEFDDYLVYVLNTENDFPWKQGKVAGSLDKVTKAAEEMKDCFDELIKNGETRPVIIAGHVPLHFSGRTSSLHTTGDNLYSSIMFDVVNDAAKSLDIIYLFGHNHTKGWDCYLGQSCIFKSTGDSILIPEYSEGSMTTDTYSVETLNFTYMNAGYVGHCMNCSPDEVDAGTVDQYKAADDTLTVTTCEVYKDKIVLTRYSEDGVYPLSSAGCASPYYDDSDLIPAKYYSTQIDSPWEIDRKQ